MRNLIPIYTTKLSRCDIIAIWVQQRGIDYQVVYKPERDGWINSFKGSRIVRRYKHSPIYSQDGSAKDSYNFVSKQIIQRVKLVCLSMFVCMCWCVGLEFSGSCVRTPGESGRAFPELRSRKTTTIYSNRRRRSGNSFKTWSAFFS